MVDKKTYNKRKRKKDMRNEKGRLLERQTHKKSSLTRKRYIGMRL